MACEPVIVFPVRHKGDPEPRHVALVTIGFCWREGTWRRGRVVVSDAEIDAMAGRAGVGAVPLPVDPAAPPGVRVRQPSRRPWGTLPELAIPPGEP